MLISDQNIDKCHHFGIYRIIPLMFLTDVFYVNIDNNFQLFALILKNLIQKFKS